jgi:hypothetical protein
VTDLSVVQYAELAAKVYDDPPQVGQADGPARARMYGGVLAFRGTDNASTWGADFDADATMVEGMGKVHDGFWKALAGVLPVLLALPRPSVIVGHSEGAALATLYAGVLCVIDRLPVAVYGFEPPRMCADDTLLKLFDAKGVMRFFTSNGSDPVPTVPPWMAIPGPVSDIGAPRGALPIIADHLIGNVVNVLRGSAGS